MLCFISIPSDNLRAVLYLSVDIQHTYSLNVQMHLCHYRLALMISSIGIHPACCIIVFLMWF